MFLSLTENLKNAREIAGTSIQHYRYAFVNDGLFGAYEKEATLLPMIANHAFRLKKTTTNAKSYLCDLTQIVY